MGATMRQETARLRLAEVFSHPSTAWVIHYACQDLVSPAVTDDRGARPRANRVTSIALSNLFSGQVFSFSFHQLITLKKLPPVRVLGMLDSLERELLDGYFDFMRHNRNQRFLHWHMRDVEFGFAAIERRYRELGGNPAGTHDGNTYDLSRMLEESFGASHAAAPRLESLAHLNGLELTGFLDVASESEAFEHGRYAAVLHSNLRKVALIAEVASAALDDALATDRGRFGELGRLAKSILVNPRLTRFASGVAAAAANLGSSLGRMR